MSLTVKYEDNFASTHPQIIADAHSNLCAYFGVCLRGGNGHRNHFEQKGKKLKIILTSQRILG